MKHLGIFFLIILFGIMLGRLVGWMIDYLPSSGRFTSWELLDSPVMFTQIMHVNSDGVWAEFTTKKLYFWRFHNVCINNPNEVCDQWLEAEIIPNDAYSDDGSQMSKGKNCPQKSGAFPKKYPGDIIECAHVFLRRGPGYYSTYFALTRDGTLWEWALPSGTDFPAMTVYICPFMGLLAGVMVGIAYLISSVTGSRSQQSKPTKRAPDVWESARFLAVFLARN